MHDGKHRGTRRVRRRRLIIPLVVVAAIAAMPLPAGGVAGFGDVDAGKFYTEPVQWIVDNAITTGTSTTCFSPGDVVTRGQVAAFMWRMEGSPTGSVAHPFKDVVAPWQQDPVSWMVQQEVTTGTSTSTYSPDDPVTRGQIAAFLWRLAGSPAAPPPSQFTDVVKSWQITPVGWMVQQEITTGTSTSTFSPEDIVTRAQVAAFFYRYKGSPPVVVDPSHPAIPVCAAQVDGPATFGDVMIDTDTTLIQNHNGTIHLIADDITLDCAGHTITGPGLHDGAGNAITVQSMTGVTVRNCHVTNAQVGVWIDDSSSITVTDSRAFGNRDDGFLMYASTDVTLTNNTANDNGVGFNYANSTGVSVSTGNVATNNSRQGFDIRGGTAGTRLENNRAEGSPVGFRLRSEDGKAAMGYELINNTAINNGIGFQVVEGGGDNTLTGNIAQDNVTGFRDNSLGGSGTAGTFNTYSQNTCAGNGTASNPSGLC